MTSRGPDYLPYPMPTRLPPPLVAAAPVETRSRWELTLAALTAWGRAAVLGGLGAFLSLLLVSLLSGHRAAGAMLAVLAATVSVAAGIVALKRLMPPDIAHLIKSSQVTGVVSAVMAVLLLMLIRPADAQPPVRVPQPTVTQEQPSPAPTPSTSPSPRANTLPPGVLPGFGLPSEPEAPLTPDSTDKGTITGLVVDSAGKAVADATIVIDRSVEGDTSDVPQCPVRSTTRTNSRGEYTLQLCQLGPDLGYQITVTARGAAATAEFFINSGRTTRYDVILAIRTG